MGPWLLVGVLAVLALRTDDGKKIARKALKESIRVGLKAKEKAVELTEEAKERVQDIAAEVKDEVAQMKTELEVSSKNETKI